MIAIALGAAAQTVLLLALAPVLDALIRLAEARTRPRVIPALLQPYHDLWKWLHKERLQSRGARIVGAQAHEMPAWRHVSDQSDGSDQSDRVVLVSSTEETIQPLSSLSVHPLCLRASVVNVTPSSSPAEAAQGNLAPSLALGAVLTAGLLAPTVARQAPLAGAGDLVALVGLLGLASVAQAFSTLAEEDGAAAVAGGRDLAHGVMALPSMLLALLVPVAQAHTTSLTALAGGPGLANAGNVAAFLALALIVLDDHRRQSGPVAPIVTAGMFALPAMDLAASGRDLALVRWARLVRQLLLLSILMGIFLPWGLARPGHDALPILVLGALLYLVKLALLGLALGTVERRLLSRRRRGSLLAASLPLGLLGLIVSGIIHA